MNKSLIRNVSAAMSFLFALLLFPSLLYSQNQPDIPKPRGPIDFSQTSNVVIFVIIPLIILVLYIMYRKRIANIKKNKREEKEDNL